jgi:LPS-assembly lipoprotein
MSARPTRRALLLPGLCAALSGCGFHPVYAPSADGGTGAAEGLAAIEVKPIYERAGQLLREALLGRLRNESGTPHHFDLQVAFWISGEAVGVLDFTQPTRLRLIASANWELQGRDAKQTKLVAGTERLIDGFDIFDSQYFAMDLDNEHVQRRLAEAMAERITLRLAMWFNQHPTAIG